MKTKLLCFMLLFVVLFTGYAQDRPDALRAFNQGRYAEAVEICFAEIEESPGNMDSYTVLGWSLLALRRYQEALDWADRGLAQRRYDIRIIAIKGEALYHLGQNVRALQTFQEFNALTSSQERPSRIGSVFYYMGEIYIRLQEYHHADIALTSAVYHSPNSSNWWARLAYAREMAGDYTYALVAYDKALELNAAHDDARRGRQRTLDAMNDDA